jgi:hypothetical protein
LLRLVCVWQTLEKDAQKVSESSERRLSNEPSLALDSRPA